LLRDDNPKRVNYLLSAIFSKNVLAPPYCR